jgi:hypothetical protein
LPEHGDVLISEIIGNEPLHERVLESTRDAIKRFLKRDARFVPQNLRIYVVPVEVPESVASRFRFMGSSQAQWGVWYDMDFSALGQGNPPRAMRIFVKPHRPSDWIRLSEPVQVASIDFSSGHPPSIQSETNVATKRAGRINGILVFFELGLSPGRVLSVDPQFVDDQCSWRLPVWLLPDPLEVDAGEHLKIRYTYGTAGHQSVVSVARAPLGEAAATE